MTNRLKMEKSQSQGKQRAVRIDEELLKLAEEAARKNHRSVPKQLEHWAELGRAVAPRLTPADIDDLLDPAVKLSLERSKAS